MKFSTIHILILLSSLPSSVFPQCDKIGYPRRLQLPGSITSADELAFDLASEGPYVGASDGIIYKYKDSNSGFVFFAYTSPNRSSELCDGLKGLVAPQTLYSICGQPIGLGFNYRTSELYAADLFRGISVVGESGGLTRPVITTDQGIPFKYSFSLDCNSDTGDIIFIDSSSRYGGGQFTKFLQSLDSTGRLLRYGSYTGEVTVLLRNLSGAVGVASSQDSSFVLVSEFSGKRIQKYWLQGQRAGSSEIIANFSGYPFKIRRNDEGNFWVAVNMLRNDSTFAGYGVKIDPSGRVLKTVDLSNQFHRLDCVQEEDQNLYLATYGESYIVQYSIC